MAGVFGKAIGVAKWIIKSKSEDFAASRLTFGQVSCRFIIVVDE